MMILTVFIALLGTALLCVGGSNLSASSVGSSSSTVAPDVFHDQLAASVADPQRPQLNTALELVRGLDFPTLAISRQLTVGAARTPLVHHLFNIYMLVASSSDRSKVVELIALCIEKGADVLTRSAPSAVSRYEPDLLYKAIFIRNVTLAQQIARRMQRDQREALAQGDEMRGAPPFLGAAADTLQLLHQLPCEPVPLAKMMLHGNNIIRQRISAEVAERRAGTGAAAAAEDKEKRRVGLTRHVSALLMGARLESGSSRNKFTFNGQELARFSPHFNASIADFVRRELELSDLYEQQQQQGKEPADQDFSYTRPNDVSLRTLMSVLQDVSVAVHDTLFDAAFDASWAKREPQLQRTKLQRLQDELPALLGTVNARRRNMLHMLAVSHSHRSICSLFRHLFGLLLGPSAANDPVEDELLRSALLQALVQRDIRGHSPLSLALSRYGRQSAAYVGLVNLLHLSTAPSRSLLAQRIADSGPGSWTDAEEEGGDYSRIVSVQGAGGAQDEVDNASEENFEVLGELLHLVEYLSLPLNMHDESEVTAATAPRAQSIAASETSLRAQWAANLPDTGGWRADEALALEHRESTVAISILDGEAVAPGSGEAGAEGAAGHADTVTRYQEAYPHHTAVAEDPDEDGQDEEGGGPSSTTVPPPHGVCDIEEVFVHTFPSSTEFFQRYLNRGKPVIFRGLALDTRIRDVFSKDAFLARYGADSVPISTIPYAGSFGQKSSGSANNIQHVTMNELANNQSTATHSVRRRGAARTEHNYAFTTARPEWSQKISRDVGVPPLIQQVQVDDRGDLQESKEIELQFYLGPAGSGAPMHIHGHAVNTLAYGRKHWFLYPPSEAFYSTQPAVDFVREDHRAHAALQCTQFGGDIIYVPALWGHATFNERQSIGVAHEFSVEQFCME